MSKRWLGSIVLLAIVVAAVIWWRNQQPVYFSLQVDNQSGQPVQQVLVSGSGVVQGNSIDSLQHGARAQLQVELADAGEVRIVVSQGWNRIDSLLAKDVGNFERNQQLTIYADNRFIFSVQD